MSKEFYDNTDHFLCDVCLNKIVIESYEERLSQYKNAKPLIKCPSCNKKINSKTYEFNNWISFLTQQRNYYKDIRNTIKCLDCGKKYNKNLFFPHDPCKHSCQDCLSTTLRLGFTNCSFCGVLFSDIQNFGLLKQNCSGCNTEKFIIGDLIIHLCDSHSHCYECMILALKAKKCKNCSKNLEKSDLEKILKRVEKYANQRKK